MITMNPSAPEVALLSPRVLAISSRLLVWDLPAAVRPINHSIQGRAPSSMYVPWPRLLLCALVTENGTKELHIVALKRQARPLDVTPLFHAPLMNTSAAGQLDLPTDMALPLIDPRDIELWENVLMQYTFSVVGHERTVRPDGLEANAAVNTYHHARCWRQIGRSELDRFPGQVLVSRRQTVAGWLEQLRSNAYY